MAASVDLCEKLVLLGGGILLGGLAAEVWLAFRPPASEAIWVGLANLLVLFGVTVEVVLGRIGSIRQGELLHRSKERLAESEERLAEVEFNNGVLQERVAEAAERAATANARAAEAEARAAEANLALAKFRAPRALSAEQQARLANEFRQFAGQKYSFNVTSDPEPINLLRLIDATLQASGWVRIGSQIGRQMVIEIDGKDVGIAHDANVQIGIKREAIQGQKELGVQLANALIREGLTTTIGFIPNLIFSDAININIGRKI